MLLKNTAKQLKLFKNTAKQLKLRDPSESLAPMPKLAYEKKCMFNA
jgi:hypothetical protein